MILNNDRRLSNFWCTLCCFLGKIGMRVVALILSITAMSSVPSWADGTLPGGPSPFCQRVSQNVCTTLTFNDALDAEAALEIFGFDVVAANEYSPEFGPNPDFPVGEEMTILTSEIADTVTNSVIEAIEPGFSPWCDQSGGKGCFAFHVFDKPLAVKDTHFVGRLSYFFSDNGYFGVTSATVFLPGRHILRRDVNDK